MQTISKALVRSAATFAGALCLVFAFAAQAGEARYADLVLSDAKDGKPKQVFAPTTAKIYLSGKLIDAPSGAKIKTAWIAEKAKGAPPNYTIDTSETTAGLLRNRADFSLSKPNAGFPVGDYRVDLSINDKVVQSVKFKVQP